MRITILEDIRKAYFWWPLHTKLRHQLIELPSWVPDFRISFVYIQHGKDVNLEWQCTPRGYFDSSTVGANINPLVRFSEDNRILHVAGAERGRVIHLQHVAIGRHSEFCELRQKLLELLSFFHTHSIPATEGVRGLTASGDWESSAKDDLEIIIKHILDHKLLELNQRLQDMVRCEIWGKTIFVTDTGHWGATIDYVHENDIVVLLFGVNFPFILRPLPSGGFQMIDAAWISGDDWKQEFPTAEELDWDSDFSQYGLRKFDIH